jgi:NAD+ synthetase
MSLYNTACKNRYLKQKFMEKYSKIFNEIVKQTGEYCVKYNLKSLVLGLSGGLDSTVCAAIGYEVSRIYGVKLIGMSLPCSTNTNEERRTATLCGECFCDEYKEINLQDLYLLTRGKCDTEIGESTHVSQGNIKARLRMIMLYNTASINNGIVIDTDNLSEHFLGFWTIHGDVGDFKPLGKLWKTEVYELAKYILSLYTNQMNEYHENGELRENNNGEWIRCQTAQRALYSAIHIKPTDGNGVAAGGDMAQIAPGYTYGEVDKVLQYLTSDKKKTEQGWEEIANTYFNGDMEMVDHIVERVHKSNFKRDTNFKGVIL